VLSDDHGSGGELSFGVHAAPAPLRERPPTLDAVLRSILQQAVEAATQWMNDWPINPVTINRQTGELEGDDVCSAATFRPSWALPDLLANAWSPFVLKGGEHEPDGMFGLASGPIDGLTNQSIRDAHEALDGELP
jgi:hypothetical protein